MWINSGHYCLAAAAAVAAVGVIFVE